MGNPSGIIPSGSMPSDAPVEANPGTLLMGQVQPASDRTGPLVTVKDIKELYLFGIPLQSALTGETFPARSIKKIIAQAVGDAETSLRIPIQPVRSVDFFDYDRSHDAYGFGEKQLSRWPLLQVEALQICFPGYDANDPSSFVNFPTNWLSAGNGASGYVRIVPVNGSVVSGDVNFVNAVGSWIPFVNSLPYWPNCWKIQYIAGFDYDQIPHIVNDLIGHLAAIRILSIFGPLIFPANGISIAQSGMTQSTSTAGPAFLAQRIAELTAEKDRILDQLKAQYQQTFIFTSF